MDDFDKNDELMLRVSSAFSNSQDYGKFALDSLIRGDYEIAKFQISQQLKWYCAYACLRDAIQTGQVLSSGEYLDEFISYIFGDGSLLLEYRDKICVMMGWDAQKEHMDERMISRFLDSCVEYDKKVVSVTKEGER